MVPDYEEGVLVPAGTVTYEFPLQFSSLYTLTESDIPSLMSYLFSDFLNFTVTYSGAGVNDGTNSFYDFFTINPFVAANPYITAEQFSVGTAKYAWNIIKHIQEVSPHDMVTGSFAHILDISPESPRQNGDFFYLRTAVTPSLTAGPRWDYSQNILPRGSKKRYKDFNKISTWLSSPFNIYKKQYIIRDFELGSLWYTHLIQTNFISVIEDGTSSIRITPEGHISYYKNDVFEYTNEVAPEAILYADRWSVENFRPPSLGAPSWYPLERTNGKAIPWVYEYKDLPFTEFSTDNIDWKPLEGVSWFYGKINRTHLELYNQAYQRQYVQDDFKITFTVAHISGEGYLINPLSEYKIYADDWRNLIYPWTVTPHTIMDSLPLCPDFNQDRKYIRLSPLFF